MENLLEIYAAKIDTLYGSYNAKCATITGDTSEKLKSPNISLEEAQAILESQAGSLDEEYAELETQLKILRREFMKQKEAEANAGEAEDLSNMEAALQQL